MRVVPNRTVVTTALLDKWTALQGCLQASLKAVDIDAAWVARLESLGEELDALAGQDPDLALYILIQSTAEDAVGYSAAHAMTCAVMLRLAAASLQLPEEAIRSACRAALTMNLSITALQDELARHLDEPTDQQRAELASHPRTSRELLERAGVADATWLAIVENHHTVPDQPVQPHEVPALLTEMLRRLDVYTAKLSRRASRMPTSTTRAAQAACLDEGGRPDTIGATLLRVLGLYPPGTWVRLASGELGIVTRRGPRAHTPLVAALRREDGTTLHRPALRDTAQPRLAVRQAVVTDEVRVRVSHVRVLAA